MGGNFISIGYIFGECFGLFSDWTFLRHFGKIGIDDRSMAFISHHWFLWGIYHFFYFCQRQLDDGQRPAVFVYGTLYGWECGIGAVDGIFRTIIDKGNLDN